MAIRKEFWRLAWPAAAEGLLLMLLTAADLLMVSALGNTAVAAVSIFSQPRMVILCVTRSYRPRCHTGVCGADHQNRGL